LIFLVIFAIFKKELTSASGGPMFNVKQDANRPNIPEEPARAIPKKEIVPYFQPIVSLQTLHIYGYEALGRMVHGNRL
jgi:sensor c-di-GMP phosphodiesterase-like protein